MKPVAVLALVALASTTPVHAQGLGIPGVATGKPMVFTYHCPTGKPFTVSYWSGDNGQSFALVPIDGKPQLLVSLMSASGVRYAAGSVIWWTKGRNADLYHSGSMDPDSGQVKPVSCTGTPAS
jgi:membrane-bound inhibitor of C-type lysozyme